MMTGPKDKPTFYNIMTVSGEIVATVSASKVLRVRAQMQKDRGEKLEISEPLKEV